MQVKTNVSSLFLFICYKCGGPLQWFFFFNHYLVSQLSISYVVTCSHS